MNDFFSQLRSLFGQPWWIEISTDAPHCLYYFGPFANKAEATQAEAGYIEDLQQEGAELLQMSVIKRSTPAHLTIERPDVSM